MLERKKDATDSMQRALSISAKDPDVKFRAALMYNHFDDTDRTLQSLRDALVSGLAASTVRDTPDFDHLRDDSRLQVLLRGH